MVDWTKQSDWIHYSHAVAKAVYYLESIISSEESLLGMEANGVPSDDPGYKQTVSEINRKERLLEITRFKIRRSWKRITESDKNTWKYEPPTTPS